MLTVSVGQVVQASDEDSDPTEITDWHDLNAVRDGLDGDYVLVANLDSDTDGYEDHVANPSDGWEPIGELGSRFTGTFDGNSNEIIDLVSDRSREDSVGLFGVAEGQIENLGVVDADVTGEDRVGILAGRISGVVTESYVTGTVEGSGSVRSGGVGGFAGSNGGSISLSFSEGTVEGDRYVGGFVGLNGGEVMESYATGTVVADSRAGGLVGVLTRPGSISASHATGAVTGEDAFVGGLVGRNNGDVTESYATGDVTGDSQVGGLVGQNRDDSEISESYATGAVTGDSEVGGLVGENNDNISESYATGDVEANEEVGGLIGNSDDGTRVTNSYATGTVAGSEQVGGFIGVLGAFSTVDGYWDVQTTGQEDGISSGSPAQGDVIGLETAQMQGSEAEENMSALDFDGVWQVVTDPAGYPHLELQGLEGLPEVGSGDSNDTDSDNGDDGFGPGFGVGGAVAGIGGVGYLLKRRLAVEDSDRDRRSRPTTSDRW